MNWLIGCLNYLNWVFNYGKAQLEWKMIKIYVDLWWGKKAYLWIPPNLHSILFHLVSYLLISLLLYIFIIYWDFQFSSVTQLCLTLCDPMDCNTPGFPVHHQLPELAQTPVHRVSDAIQPSPPLLSPSPAFNFSQHQDLFQWFCNMPIDLLPWRWYGDRKLEKRGNNISVKWSCKSYLLLCVI